MIRFFTIATLSALIGMFPAAAQNTDKDKNVDVRSPMGDLHVGKDADAQKAGLPIYPGARTQRTEENDPVNLAISTDNFGMKLIVAKYETDDPPEKVLAFYREKMKKYGKVLECHSTEDKSGFHHDDDDKNGNQPLKCEGDSSGPVRELKVGTVDNQRFVELEDKKEGNASDFLILFLI